MGVGERRVHLVVDFDEIRGGAGDRLRLGDDDRQYIAVVGGATALGDEHRPVLVDDPDVESTGDVRACEHCDHARDGLCRRGVDADHVGPRMFGEMQRTLEETIGSDVVHVAPVTERQFDALVLRSRISDPGRCSRGSHLAGDQQVDRLEDLRISGAATQVRSKTACGRLPIEIRPLLIDERLRAHENAGSAEPALERSRGSEGVGEMFALFDLKSFEGRDALSLGLVHRDEAALDRLAVDKDGARPTLPGRRTAVLGRGDTELLAQGGEEVRVIGRDLDRESIDGERSGFHRRSSSRLLHRIILVWLTFCQFRDPEFVGRESATVPVPRHGRCDAGISR